MPKNSNQYTTLNPKTGQVVSVDFIKGWFGASPTEVKAGVIDQQAVRVFTSGQCHALALEIHKRTGWELYGAFTEEELETGDTPGHTLVKAPDGEFIDIEGIGAGERWQRKELVPVSEKDVLGFDKLNYLPPNREVAALFVDAVLTKIEEQRVSGRYNSYPY